ncbi:MAG TPA: cbb3-type cytochrome c oxidase subunit 3 [Woeseiaceae bacterium]|nr:cbb3-type cytochrome c oxidase subunit 3 [Woeseiaceae bacterium]
MDINTFRGLITLALMILFLALVIWTFSSGRRRDFEEAAQLPLGDDEQPPVEKKESN